MYAMLAGAVCAAIDGIRSFHAVTNNSAAAMGTRGRQRMDRALEAIEHVSLAAHLHLKAFIISVAAYLTCCSRISKHTFLRIHIYLFSMTSCVERLVPS